MRALTSFYGGVILFRLNRLLLPLLCFLVVTSAAFAQTGMTSTLTREDQISLTAPTWKGQTGLFTTVTGDTLHRGDLSFGLYFQNFDLLAAPAQPCSPSVFSRLTA